MRTTIFRTVLYVALPLMAAACGGTRSGYPAPLAGQEPTRYSLAPVDPPEGRSWVECPGGEAGMDMAVIGPGGDELQVPGGHALVVTPNAVRLPSPFLFGSLPSDQVAVHATGPLVRLSGNGAIVRLSWADRPDCEVPQDAVIVQLRGPNQPAQELESRVDLQTQTIETAEPVYEFSAFAIAR